MVGLYAAGDIVIGLEQTATPGRIEGLHYESSK
jgi:hypothetical protein